MKKRQEGLESFEDRREAHLDLVAHEHPACKKCYDEEWPQFRGQNVDGIADAPAVFSGPREVSLEVGWKTSIGSGYAGIAIASGLVATMFEAGDVNVLAAFDPETGAERWCFELGERHPGIDGSYNGPISTPLIVGNLAFGLDPWGHLVAVDRLDGELVWSKHLVEELGAEQPNYGFATSPILMDGKMIVSPQSSAAQTVSRGESREECARSQV